MKNFNPVVNELWRPFKRALAVKARAHRGRFVPDDEFTCSPPVLARVKRHAVEVENELPVRSVVEVIQVGPPQVSSNFMWRKVGRPYIDAVVLVDGEKRHCNLESLEPVR
jgi:hypothetical protein